MLVKTRKKIGPDKRFLARDATHVKNAESGCSLFCWRINIDDSSRIPVNCKILLISKIRFFFYSGFEFLMAWFDFKRNDSAQGDSPFTVTECVLVHNYALQYLADKKYNSAKPFWNSAAPLSAIKTKLIQYLQGIDNRSRMQKNTPCNNFNGIVNP